MKVNIKTTGIELSQAIREYVNKKLSSIEKLLTHHAETVIVDVDVGKSTEHHKQGPYFRAEVHVTGKDLDLYAVSEKEDLYMAIDEVKEEILGSLTQAKGKKETLARRGSRMVKYMMKGLTITAGRGLSWGRGKIRRLKRRR